MNYLIEYKAKGDLGVILKQGTMRAKGKASEFEAKAGLENYLAKTLPGFKKLEITKCQPESVFGPGLDFFSEIFNK